MSKVNKDFRHTFANDVAEGFKTKNGIWWRPSVAYPYIGIRYKCSCGRKFKTHEDFNAHYIYKAFWENESGYIENSVFESKNNVGKL